MRRSLVENSQLECRKNEVLMVFSAGKSLLKLNLKSTCHGELDLYNAPLSG
tara:strand:+ start:41776 stop:41928 length:153 start_codon:yes stop_codon:yes gene_type:complete